MFFLLEGVLVGGQIWFDLTPLGEFCSEENRKTIEKTTVIWD